MIDPFEGAEAKLARAKEILEDLRGFLTTTFDREESLARLAIRFDPTAKRCVVYVDAVPDSQAARIRVAILAGDILNNLRSALDYLAIGLARDRNGGPLEAEAERQIEFPLYDNRTRWTKAKGKAKKGRGNLWHLRGHWVALEKVQPFGRPRNDPKAALKLLREMNNTDKHRLLLVVVVVPKKVSMDLSGGPRGSFAMLYRASKPRGMGGAAWRGLTWLSRIEPGIVLFRFRPLGRDKGMAHEDEQIATVRCSLAFHDERRTVDATLERLIRAVEFTLARFRQRVGEGTSR